MKKLTILFIAIFGFIAQAQEYFTGTILVEEGENSLPVEGANVYWLGTQTGTITNQKGTFSLPFIGVNQKLVISYIGFKSDTLSINDNKPIMHLLSTNTLYALNEVTLTQRRKAIQKAYFETQNIINVNSAELLKAACCNLSCSCSSGVIVAIIW